MKKCIRNFSSFYMCLLLLSIQSAFAFTCPDEAVLRRAEVQAEIHRWCEIKNNKQGHYEITTWEGALIVSMSFQDDKRHGPFKRQTPQGLVLVQGNYAHGIPEGKWTRYFGNGTLRDSGEWVQGRPHGVWQVAPGPGAEPQEVTFVNGVRKSKRPLLRAGFAYTYLSQNIGNLHTGTLTADVCIYCNWTYVQPRFLLSSSLLKSKAGSYFATIDPTLRFDFHFSERYPVIASPLIGLQWLGNDWLRGVTLGAEVLIPIGYDIGSWKTAAFLRYMRMIYDARSTNAFYLGLWGQF